MNMEINIYKNNENIKCIVEELQKPNDMATLINAIKKTKEISNAYLTELVEIEKSSEPISDKRSKKVKRKDNLKSIYIYNYTKMFNLLTKLYD